MKFFRCLRWSIALAAALGWPAAQAQDVQAGRLKAQSCVVCHGPLGLSVTPDAPHLAAQPALYVAAQLRAYRSGARKHEVMAVMAKPLTDDDITNLAAWFASIRVEAQPPQ
jgi:cytochrome c553